MASSLDTNGTREHLTPSQTKTLYSLWRRFFRLCETPATDYAATSSSSATASASTSTSAPDTGEARFPTPSSASGDKYGAVGHDNSIPSSSSKPGLLPHSTSSQSNSNGKPAQRHPVRSHQIDEHGSHIPKDDKVKDELKTIEEAKEMREFLEKYGGERLREIFWDMVKGEHPDAVMLRFLRARKWDIDRAIAVIGSTAAFRAENNVTEIVRGGELTFTRTRGAMKIMTNGISYIYGATAIGEPIYFIEVGNHFSHNQTQEELKRGVILLQEYMQMMMPPPIERKVVVFNMNEFGIRNMDWWCVFFMVKTMESYYVETLAKVYVHGAPWIFRPIWAILKPLLDPVVREKIRLTSSPEELAEHIPFNHLPKKSMRGGLDWEFEYPIPDEHENDVQQDTQTRDKLKAEYNKYAQEFEAATKEICQLYTRSSLLQRARDGPHQDFSSESEQDEEAAAGGSFGIRRNYSNTDEIGADLKAKRDVIATRLRVAFLKLKPYIVGKSLQERWGNMRPDGSIYWEYPTIEGTVEKQELGQGTLLHELETNLAMIDQAQSHGQNGLHDINDALESSSIAENNRQKRLKNRSKATDTAVFATSSEEPISTTKSAPAKSSDDNKTSSNQSNPNSASTITPGVVGDRNAEGEIKELKPVPVHPLQESSKQVF